MILLFFLFLFVSACSFNPGLSVQERAVSAGDVSICNSASHPDYCKLAVAKKTLDSGICDSVVDPALKRTCFASVSSSSNSDCGSRGLPCCDGGVCDDTYVCLNNKCVGCGVSEKPCCANGVCFKNYRCGADGLCHYNASGPLFSENSTSEIYSSVASRG